MTRPEREPNNNKTALLVIDVQQGLFELPKPVYKAEELLQNITSIIDRAHQARVPVIYIQHSGEKILKKGSPAWQLHPQLQPLKIDTIIHKLHGNAFEETPLDGLLKKNEISSLVITGLVTHGCVKDTCLGALGLGYRLTLVTDAHSNLSKQAPKLIKEWNKKISERGAELMSTADIAFHN